MSRRRDLSSSRKRKPHCEALESRRLLSVDLVSFDSAGAATGDVRTTAISGDGNYVAFSEIEASFPFGAPAQPDTNLYVRDLSSGNLETIALPRNGGSGIQEISISGDGRFIAFQTQSQLLPSDTNTSNAGDIYLYDRGTDLSSQSDDTLSLVTDEIGSSGASGASLTPKVTQDGNFVFFLSTSSQLATNTIGTNTNNQLFRYEINTANITQISGLDAVESPGTDRVQFYDMSDDGSRAAYGARSFSISERTDIHTFDASTNSVLRTQPGLLTTGAVRLALSGDGEVYYFTVRGTGGLATTTIVYRKDFELGPSVSPAEIGRQVVDGPSPRLGVTTLDTNQDGSILAVRNGVSQIIQTGSRQQNLDGKYDIQTLVVATGEQATIASDSLVGGVNTGPFLDSAGDKLAFLARDQLTSGDQNTSDDTYAFTPPGIQFTSNAFSVLESSSAEVIVERAGNLSEVEQVQLVLSAGSQNVGSDFDSSTIEVTFQANESQKTVLISIIDDAIVEPVETIEVTLLPIGSALISGITQTTVSIEDDDQTTLIVTPTEVAEADTIVNVAITSSNEVQGGFTVDASTISDTATATQDFTNSNATLAFTGNADESIDFAIPIAGDTLIEPNEAIQVALANIVAAGIDGNAFLLQGNSVTITNDDYFSGISYVDANNDGHFLETDGDALLAGVTVQLIDQSTNTVIATEITGESGEYTFDVTLPIGAYTIRQTQPEELLDGQETAASGTVDNSQDNNDIADLEVTNSGAADAAIGFLFADIEPAGIGGNVWEDFNGDGYINFSEFGIGEVEVRLTGSDDRGAPVDAIVETNPDGTYGFGDLRPGTYSLTEMQPTTNEDGIDRLGTIDGAPVGTLGNDSFSDLTLAPGSTGSNYNFGEKPVEGTRIESRQTASLGFWTGYGGRQLLRQLNGSPTATQLGDWLAASFPNIFGADAGQGNLAGKTNVQVGRSLRRLVWSRPNLASHLKAQVLTTALNVYVTNENLAGRTAERFGFQVTGDGLGTQTFNVGRFGSVFGVENNSRITVMDALLAVNDSAHNGVLFDFNEDGDNDERDEWRASIRAYIVFRAINRA